MHAPSQQTEPSYVLRVHGADNTDHRGFLLVEEFRTQQGATYVQQHRVPPNAASQFVQQFAQRHPNVQVQRVDANGTDASTPSHAKAHTSAAPTPDGFSTSTIGGLDGYDKYGSSYGSFASANANVSGNIRAVGGIGTGGGTHGSTTHGTVSPSSATPRPQPYEGC